MALLGVAGLLWLCFRWGTPRLEVRNLTSAPVSAVTARAGGQVIDLGELSERELACVDLEPQGDSGVVITYATRGQPLRCAPDSYVTGGFGGRMVVELEQTGKCSLHEEFVDPAFRVPCPIVTGAEMLGMSLEAPVSRSNRQTATK